MINRNFKQKLFAGGSILAVAMLAITGCGAAGASNSSPGGSDVVLRLGTPFAAAHPLTEAAEELSDRVEKETQGRVKIKVFSAGQLGTEAEMNQAILDGSLDMRQGNPPTDERPELQVISAPYLFDSPENAVNGFRSEIAQELLWEPTRADLGIVALDSWYFGEYNMTSNKKFTDPESAVESGVISRVTPAPLFVDLASAMGFQTSPLPFNELYTALQTGVVDGQLNPLSQIYSSNLFEVQDYYMPVGVITQALPLFIREESLNKMSAADQETLMSLSHAVGDEVLTEVTALEENWEKQAALDMELVNIDDDAFRSAIEKEFLPKYDSIFGEGVYKKLQDSVK